MRLRTTYTLLCAACIGIFGMPIHTQAQELTQSVTPAAVVDPLNNPEQVDLRRDEPRTPLLPYNKAELARSGAIELSTYIQPMEGEWRVKHFSAPTTIDTTLTAPTINTATWDVVQIPSEASNTDWASIYRRTFKMPFAWIDREVFVHVGTVSRAYFVYVNGRQVGYHEDAKTEADFNLSKYVEEGINHLSIIAYSAPISTTLENQITTRGTSLEAPVYIFSQPKVRMRDYVIDTRFAPDGTSGLFNLGVIVKSHLLNPKEVMVYYDLYGPNGELVRSDKRDARFDMRREDTVRFFANIPNIDSWSHESPKLYTVALRLQHEGRYTEYTTIKVGFRQVQFNNQGLTINGQPLEIRAIDYTPPSSESALKSDFLKFKSQGINLLRVSNFPQREQFYDLCDAYGLYVCDQANLDAQLSGESLQVGGTPANDTLWAQAYTDRILNMYHFSQNHPSVIMFSLGRPGAGRGYNMYEAYLRMKEIETDRPILYEGAGAEWNTDIVVGNPPNRNPSDNRYRIAFKSPTAWSEAPATGRIEIKDSAPQRGKATIQNGLRMANLTNFKVGYTILAKTKVVSEGLLPSNIAPGTSAQVEAPLEGLKPGKYTLTIYVEHRDTTPIVKRGERLAQKSYNLVIPKPPKK